VNVLNYLRHPERLFALVLIGLAAVLYALAEGMQEAYGPGAIAASTYPKLVLVCIMVICVLILLKPVPVGSTAGRISLQGLPVIIMTGIYIALIEPIGFFIVTPVYLFILPLFAGFRDYVSVMISVIVITASLYGVFVELLDIPLPAGLLAE
jgi:hypothetical protein